MNVGIITIHNVSNYGAILQAFALKETVKKRHKVNIIDFNNRHVSKSLDLVRFGTDFHALLGTAKDICRILPRQRVIKKFNKFLDSYMDVVPFNLQETKKFDTLISGSDQIWNPACVTKSNSFVPEYFLSFAETEQKKVAYASSCGAYNYSEREQLILKEYLEKYDYLSTRENVASKFLTRIAQREVKHVLDPTLLLTKDEWLDRLGDNGRGEGDYILLYVIKKTNLLKTIVRKAKEVLGLKVVLVEQGLHFDSCVDEHVRDAGPLDFISLFNNARFIITDSFHGTTFSVIFGKPFVSVSPGANVNRISSLLGVLGLDSRILHSEDDLSRVTPAFFNLDFTTAHEKLNIERGKSLTYLNESI